MEKHTSKLAFSLIELSVVILIIGILVIGITKGSRIIKTSKLRTAQSLTNSSPVASTDNLILWYESTLDKSFNSGEATDTALGSAGSISSWNDINSQTTTPNNAIQATAGNKPRYLASAMNGLPAVNFDGAAFPNGDNLTFNGNGLVNTNYTIFLVEQRRAGGFQPVIGGHSSTTNGNLQLGYRNSIRTAFDQYFNDCGVDISAYSYPIPKINTYVFSSTLGKNHYINGVAQNPTCASPNVGLISFVEAAIGRLDDGNWNSYTGDVGEVIMFNRYLTNTERSNIEKYLKTKWGVR